MVLVLEDKQKAGHVPSCLYFWVLCQNELFEGLNELSALETGVQCMHMRAGLD